MHGLPRALAGLGTGAAFALGLAASSCDAIATLTVRASPAERYVTYHSFSRRLVISGGSRGREDEARRCIISTQAVDNTMH